MKSKIIEEKINELVEERNKLSNEDWDKKALLYRQTTSLSKIMDGLDFYSFLYLFSDHDLDKTFLLSIDEINKRYSYLKNNYKQEILPELCNGNDEGETPNMFDYNEYTRVFENNDINLSRTFKYLKSLNVFHQWDLKYLIYLMYHDKFFNENHLEKIIKNNIDDNDKTRIGLKNNINIINTKIKESKNVNYNEYINLIFNIYNYLYPKKEIDIIDNNDIYLIHEFVDLYINLINCKKLKIDKLENSKYGNENDAVKEVLCLLSSDLICTIIEVFPNYYSTHIMFIGHGFYSSAGGDDSILHMKSLDNFINDIFNYDFWIETSDYSLKEILEFLAK